ncbi:hypothetical protein OIU77_025507 [Salix suchowensis]|uniref:Uncharacterized protein n=1 Tax=Salix suchowensis TaxID=1278906 RepID=A0ABQ9BXA7_9ROSI|nr:hypothetical protein OIU77_025507 [Salix suchowensis]
MKCGDERKGGKPEQTRKKKTTTPPTFQFVIRKSPYGIAIDWLNKHKFAFPSGYLVMSKVLTDDHSPRQIDLQDNQKVIWLSLTCWSSPNRSEGVGGCITQTPISKLAYNLTIQTTISFNYCPGQLVRVRLSGFGAC